MVSLELSEQEDPGVPAYEVPSLVARLGDQCTRVKDLAIRTGATSRSDEFYGDIGESALSSFSSFSLDFHAMHFSCERRRSWRLHGQRYSSVILMTTHKSRLVVLQDARVLRPRVDILFCHQTTSVDWRALILNRSKHARPSGHESRYSWKTRRVGGCTSKPRDRGCEL